MNRLTLSRLPIVGIPALALALLLVAPVSLAQVPTDPPVHHGPPTPEMMDEQRTHLDERMQRFDRQLTQFEDRMRTAPADQRERMQRHHEELRQERDALRQDLQRLEGVPTDQWTQQYQPIQDRLTQMETRAQRHMRADAAPMRHDPPTAAEMQQQRQDLDQRLRRADQQFTQLERRVAGVRDAQVRADLEAQVGDLRQQREQLRQDIAGLEGVEAAHWRDRYRPVGERMGEVEARAHRVNLAAAPTRDQYRTVAGRTLDQQRNRFAEMHQQMADLRAEQRAATAYELIQLRSRYDNLWRQHQRMARATPAAFEQQRHDFTDQVARLETDMHRVNLDLVAPTGMAVGPRGR